MSNYSNPSGGYKSQGGKKPYKSAGAPKGAQDLWSA